MEPPASSDVTQLLRARQTDTPEVHERLWAEVYDDLRDIAHRQLRRGGAGHTLSTTALVHECYLRLVDQSSVDYEDRLHFFATAAQAMRHLLIDRARRRTAKKRGGDAPPPLDLDDLVVAAEDTDELFLSLDEALTQLSTRDARLGKVVEYRFFGGMQEKEIAALLGVSVRTVRRDWRKAKRWLARALPRELRPSVS